MANYTTQRLTIALCSVGISTKWFQIVSHSIRFDIINFCIFVRCDTFFQVVAILHKFPVFTRLHVACTLLYSRNGHTQT